jgi:hypothetical protein
MTNMMLPALAGLLLVEILLLVQVRRAGRRTPLVAVFCTALALFVIAGLLWPVVRGVQSAGAVPVPMMFGGLAMLAAGVLGLRGMPAARDACWYILLGVTILTVFGLAAAVATP